MSEGRPDRQPMPEAVVGGPDPLRVELEGEIQHAVEAELRDVLDQEQRERVIARLRAELAEEIQVRIARVKAELAAELLAREAPAPVRREFERFSWNFRAQHWILLTSCLTLIVTGLPLKFHEARISQLFFDRIGAVGLIAVGTYHLFYLAAFREGRRNFLKLLPQPQDVRDLFQMFRYFLGRSEERPRFGRFSYVEKFDYWAVYWGMVVMIGSGLILWFLETSLQYLPKFAADIAREAHSDEGLLATLAIIIWHFYNVHLNPEHFPMNRTFLTGKISEAEMRAHHPLEYEEILAARGLSIQAPAGAGHGEGPVRSPGPPTS